MGDVQRARRLLEDLQEACELGPRHLRRLSRGLIAHRLRGRRLVVEGEERRLVAPDDRTTLRLGDPRLKGLPLDVAHRDVGDAALDARVVNATDPRVVQLRRHRRFTAETRELPLQPRPLLSEGLQRDPASKTRVRRAVDAPLPATPDLLFEDVGAQLIRVLKLPASSLPLSPERLASASRWANGLDDDQVFVIGEESKIVR